MKLNTTIAPALAFIAALALGACDRGADQSTAGGGTVAPPPGAPSGSADTGAGTPGDTGTSGSATGDPGAGGATGDAAGGTPPGTSTDPSSGSTPGSETDPAGQRRSTQ